MINKILSGGQTGADRGGLDASIVLGIEHNGYCPKGRKSEDGKIPKIYNMIETESDKYPPRTLLNIKNSDGTIIFTKTPMGRGSELTIKFCKQETKPYAVIYYSCFNSDKNEIKTMITNTAEWIKFRKINCLNIAGSRESHCPGIQETVKNFLVEVINELRVS